MTRLTKFLSSSSSIHNSLTHLLLCVSLLAIFLHSFRYCLQPWHQHITRVDIDIVLTMNLSNSVPLVDDDLMSPPINVTAEERIAWFKPKLKDSNILKSTNWTRDFHNKITTFLSQGNDNNNSSCNVSFFMTWISPMKLFGKRELLSLESVLKSHPRGCVVILSRSIDSNQGRTILEPLVSYGHRILAVAPDFHLLFNNTPAKGWLERLEAGLIDPGRIPITQNLSNLLRLVALYKYGGVYIDTDVLILKDVSRLKNSIGVQSIEDKARNRWTTLNNAVLIFDKGHPILWKFMEEFAYTFNGNKWGFNGPFLVTRVVFRRNQGSKLKINVLPPIAFYPVDWIQIREYFRNQSGVNDTIWVKEQFNQVNNESYGIHLWNKESRRLEIEKGSIIGRLISDHCIICKDIYSSSS